MNNRQPPLKSYGFQRPLTSEEIVKARQSALAAASNPQKRRLTGVTDSSNTFTTSTSVLTSQSSNVPSAKRQRLGQLPIIPAPPQFQEPPQPPLQPKSNFQPAPDLSGFELPPSQAFGSTPNPYSLPIYSQAPAPTQASFRNTSNARSLAHPKWGLRRDVVLGFRECGITEMYPWQEECLSIPGLLEGTRSIVYTAPTSSGKSLVADVLLIKKVVEQRKKAIIIVPYVSIVQEKTRFLKKVLGKMRVEVERKYGSQKRSWRELRIAGFHSGTRQRMGWEELDIVICTTEKANGMVNAGALDHRLDELGIVVFDELHMLDDEYRGFIMELLATKILCLTQEIQIIGMSATLSNVDVMARWLRAEYYHCTFRPVPLVEHLVCANQIQTYDGKPISEIPPSDDPRFQKDTFLHAIVKLATGPVMEGHGVLVFCESKYRCEVLALVLAEFIPYDHLGDEVLEKRSDLIRDLATGITGMDQTLEKTIPAGVAFHHAGMTAEERDLIAEAYDKGIIKLICCTPTMAAGVNLPARRVVIYPRTGRDWATPAMVRQMRGRAGRAGRDTYGESFIVCREKELPEVRTLLSTAMPSVSSCLATSTGAAGLSRALLEVITIRLATSPFSIEEYFHSTLLYHLRADEELPKLLSDSLKELESLKLIQDEGDGFWSATKVGEATVAAGLSPTDGVFLEKELERCLRNFNLENDMQVIYCFTPIHGTNTPHDLRMMRWDVMRDEMEKFDEATMRAALFITVKPGLVNKRAMIGGDLDESTPELHSIARTHRRFYLSLILRDLINEQPIRTVATKFSCPRGAVQQLAITARGFAATSATFCRVMGWSGLAVLLDHYTSRLDMGVRDDLVELARLPFVKSKTARVFWEEGLKKVEDVMREGVEKVEDVLWKSLPERVRRKRDEAGDGEEGRKLAGMMRERAEIVVRAAERLWKAECEVVLDEY